MKPLLVLLLLAFSTLVSATTAPVVVPVPTFDVKVWWSPMPLKDPVTGALDNPETGSITYELWGGKQGATPVLIAEHLFDIVYVVKSPPASTRCYFVITVYIDPATKIAKKTAPSNTACAEVPAVPVVKKNLVPQPVTDLRVEVQQGTP